MPMKLSKPMEKIQLYLNSEITTNCVKRASGDGTKNIELTWTISPIVLNEYSVLKLITMQHTSTSHSAKHGDKILTFRLKDVLYNPELFRTNDNSPYPVVFAGSYVNNEPVYYNYQSSGIGLLPQTINTISMILTDDIANAYSGIDADLKFFIGLSIEPYDRTYSDYEN